MGASAIARPHHPAMREPPRPRPRPRRRRRHAGTTTPPSVAADSDASSTVLVRSETLKCLRLMPNDVHNKGLLLV